MAGCVENHITSLIRKIRDIFPQAQICYSRIQGHVYTLIDGNYYDIEGIHFKVPEDICPLIIGRDTNRIVGTKISVVFLLIAGYRKMQSRI